MIAFDIQLLLKGEKTGIGWCAENVLSELGILVNEDMLLNCFTLGYDKPRIKEILKFKDMGYQIQTCSWFSDIVYRFMWNFIPVPYSFFFRRKISVTVFFNYVVPPGVSGKTVAVVHDMAYRAYPETVRKKTRHFLELSLEKSCKRADVIITISEYSRKEIIKYLDISESKIKVVPLGVDFSRFHSGYSKETIKTIKNKYALTKKYILYLGTIEPRKNLERLIYAYDNLRRTSLEVPDLVLAGRKGWMYESIFKAVDYLSLRGSVHFLGYVIAEDVPVLLSGAEIFVFPSLYEGFGLPPLEAMACGVPVVTTNVSSLPEVVGDAAVLVDPLNIESISEGISLLLNNEEYRKDIIKRGFSRVKEFTWKKTAEKFMDICVRLAGQR